VAPSHSGGLRCRTDETNTSKPQPLWVVDTRSPVTADRQPQSGTVCALRPRYTNVQPRRQNDYPNADNVVRRPGAHASALTETGSLVVASASGSQLPGYAGGAAYAIWIVGAQKVVPDLSTALRRVQEHALPLETARAEVAYGRPSAVNRLLILNAEPQPGRGTVLLLREAIGF